MKYTIFNRRTELLRVPLAKAMFYEALWQLLLWGVSQQTEGDAARWPHHC